MTLFAATLFSTSLVFAAIDEYKTGDIDILRAQGYSESTLRIMDTVMYQNKSASKKYERRFVKNPNTYSRIKVYVDPIQDDDSFGEHQINFTNTWNGDETHYTTTKVENAPVENL